MKQRKFNQVFWMNILSLLLIIRYPIIATALAVRTWSDDELKTKETLFELFPVPCSLFPVPCSLL